MTTANKRKKPHPFHKTTRKLAILYARDVKALTAHASELGKVAPPVLFGAAGDGSRTIIEKAFREYYDKVLRELGGAVVNADFYRKAKL